MNVVKPRITGSRCIHLCCLVSLQFCVHHANAHETWVLTPEQIEYFNSLPKPSLYTELSITNLAIVSSFLIFILGWIRLGFTGARELFPDLQARLASYGEHVPRILRVCLAWMLIHQLSGWNRVPV